MSNTERLSEDKDEKGERERETRERGCSQPVSEGRWKKKEEKMRNTEEISGRKTGRVIEGRRK